MRDDEAIGALVIRRIEVRPFSDKQIELLTTFADQAVIAIENVRLFEEVQARNREISEALEQQTATGAILRVISGLPDRHRSRFCRSSSRVLHASAIRMMRSSCCLKTETSRARRHTMGPIPLSFGALADQRAIRSAGERLCRPCSRMHVLDLQAAGAEFPVGQALALRAGHRTIARDAADA